MKAITYFHPSGKSMPNGIFLQKGGFAAECRSNTNSFMGMDKPDVGIIVFGNNTIDDLTLQAILFQIENQEYKVESGNFFYGQYVTDNISYGPESLCFCINNISFGRMKKLVRSLKSILPEAGSLIKHSDSNRIFIS